MRLERCSGLTKEQGNGSDSLGRRSGMEWTTYTLFHDQGRWCGYLKGHPDYQVHGESFEELQLKLHELHLDLRRSPLPSACSNAILLRWYEARRLSRISY